LIPLAQWKFFFRFSPHAKPLLRRPLEAFWSLYFILFDQPIPLFPYIGLSMVVFFLRKCCRTIWSPFSPAPKDNNSFWPSSPLCFQATRDSGPLFLPIDTHGSHPFVNPRHFSTLPKTFLYDETPCRPVPDMPLRRRFDRSFFPNLISLKAAFSPCGIKIPHGHSPLGVFVATPLLLLLSRPRVALHCFLRALFSVFGTAPFGFLPIDLRPFSLLLQFATLLPRIETSSCVTPSVAMALLFHEAPPSFFWMAPSCPVLVFTPVPFRLDPPANPEF